MKPENILKGKMAECLVKQLLKKSGNKVFRFGYERILQNLTQLERNFDRESETGKKIASIPDFIVINQRKRPLFVEVKFRTNPEALEEELLLEKEFLEKFWEAKIILVTLKKPYFRVLTPPYFQKAKKEGWPIPIFKWLALEKDVAFGVETKILKEFEKLVEKYYLPRSEILTYPPAGG